MSNDSIGKLRLTLGWIVVAVWLGSVILSAVSPAHQPPASVHLLMMLVAGALFGPRITGRGGNGA